MRQPLTAAFHRLGALLCLLGYLSSATPLPWVLAVGVAWLDDEHEVMLSAGKHGVSLVLHHADVSPQTSSIHFHCPIARGLVFLADPSPLNEADHVLSFAATHAEGIRQGSLRVTAPLPHWIPRPHISDFPFHGGLPTRSLPAVVSTPSPPATLSVCVTLATVFLI